MSRDDILEKIKETEINIKNWYTIDDESESLSNYYLRIEKRYLRILKMKLGDYNNDRIERLMESIECF